MRKRSRFSTAYWQTRPKALTARSSQPSATHARANARRASHAKSANQLNSKPTNPKRVCPSPVEEEGKRALTKLCLDTVSAHREDSAPACEKDMRLTPELIGAHEPLMMRSPLIARPVERLVRLPATNRHAMYATL